MDGTILIHLPNWVGDGALAAPCVRALMESRPEDAFLLAGTARSAPLYGRWPRASLVVVGDRRGAVSWMRAAAVARASRPIAACVLAPSFRSALYAWISGAPRRIGYATDARGSLLTDPLRPPPRDTHLARHYLEIASRLGVDPNAPLDPSLPIGEDEGEAAEARLQALGLPPKGTIALCPGATFGETKRWPRENWIALGERLARQGFILLLVGGPGEQVLCDGIAEQIGRGARSLAGRTTLRESLAIFRSIAAAVSNDSGAMHLAAAAGCPTLGLFGSTNPAWTGPLGERARALSLGLACAPCYGRECPTRIECLRDLAPDRVARALESLMEEGGGGG